MTSKDHPQEFERAAEITLQMELTPEQLSKLTEWDASIPTLHFLDICVVAATKLSQSALEKDARKAKIVEHLKALDRPQNGISYLLALMEKVSSSSGTASDTELEKQILGDLNAVRGFFKHAKVYERDEFAISFLHKLRRDPIEIQRPSYLKFLVALNNQYDLINPKSPELRLQVAEELLEFAKSLEIDRQHPVFILALSCLYGNLASKQLMKFKKEPEKFKSEIVLADIMAISRYGQMKLQIEHLGRHGGKYLRTSYITDDSGLLGLIGLFHSEKVRLEKNSDTMDTNFKFRVELEQLLPEISPDEYSIILRLLKCN